MASFSPVQRWLRCSRQSSNYFLRIRPAAREHGEGHIICVYRKQNTFLRLSARPYALVVSINIRDKDGHTTFTTPTQHPNCCPR